MQGLLTAHVRRYQEHSRTSGHVWRPIQGMIFCCRTSIYGLNSTRWRAKLVKQAVAGPWSGLRWLTDSRRPKFLHAGLVPPACAWRS
jgi:hypothetical protein